MDTWVSERMEEKENVLDWPKWPEEMLLTRSENLFLSKIDEGDVAKEA